VVIIQAAMLRHEVSRPVPGFESVLVYDREDASLEGSLINEVTIRIITVIAVPDWIPMQSLTIDTHSLSELSQPFDESGEQTRPCHETAAT
jgi:hypothetical protein